MEPLRLKEFQKNVDLVFQVIMQPLVYTLFNISTLLYSLTIEQFLMQCFSMCATLHSALVSKSAL